MPKAVCAICKQEDWTDNLYYCAHCNLWVHYGCGKVSEGFFSITRVRCPNCKRELKKE